MKALIADDHVIFRSGLRAVLEGMEPDTVIFEAGDCDTALRVAEDQRDLTIMILDLRMPGMDGFAGLNRLRRKLPSVPILVLSASEDAEDVFQALEAGASGYLAKSAPPDTLVEALRVIAIGGVYVPRSLVAGREPLLPAAPPASLTPRQNEVLSLVAAGHSNKEIAFRLGTSDGTVKAHISGIMRQLGVHNRVQLLLTAERRGIRIRSAD